LRAVADGVVMNDQTFDPAGPSDSAEQLRIELMRASAELRVWQDLFFEQCLDVGDGELGNDVDPGIRWQFGFHQRRVAALQRALDDLELARERDHGIAC
jgi:hypothetical protein